MLYLVISWVKEYKFQEFKESVCVKGVFCLTEVGVKKLKLLYDIKGSEAKSSVEFSVDKLFKFDAFLTFNNNELV